MPAPLDESLREAVKAHAITHGLRPAAAHFGLPVGTLGAWSARDPDGPWCPRTPPAITRPATLQPSANSANTPSVAAKNALESLGSRSRLNLARAVDKGAKTAAKLPGELVLAQADSVGSLVRAGDKLHGWSETGAKGVGAVAVVVVQAGQAIEGRVIDA